MATSGASKTAQKTWEAENNVKVIDDNVYKTNHAALQSLHASKPWKTDNHYFQHVRLSALALLKMAMHARRGGKLEVMGVLQGRVEQHTFVVLDVFALPVEGTETRINASAEATEYMVQYMELISQVGKTEHAVGWYHSHPGYGCWLSGIDVATERLNQQFQDPWLAIVIDPVRTIAGGKVEIGAFRTYPEGYKPPDSAPSEYQSIPSEKVEDFGVHADCYYNLDITLFKSTLDATMLDLLWNRYWINTLASSPLITNKDYITASISDIAEKLEKAEGDLGHMRGGLGVAMGAGFPSAERGRGKEDSALKKVTKDSTKASVEVLNGLFVQVMKEYLFNHSNSRTAEAGNPGAAQ